jgi:hypothetical protein
VGGNSTYFMGPHNLRLVGPDLDNATPFDAVHAPVDLHDGVEACAPMVAVKIQMGWKNSYGLGLSYGYPGWLEGVALRLGRPRPEDPNATIGPIPKATANSNYVLASYPFDWRLGLVATLDGLEKEVKRLYAERGGRIDVIGHSLGGTLLRWYLMYGTRLPAEGSNLADFPLKWDGKTYIDNAIFLGPPNEGSPQIFDSLLNGEKISAALPKYPAALLATFPASFLLAPHADQDNVVWYSTDRKRDPIDGHHDGDPVDIWDLDHWRDFEWGVFAPDQRKARAALWADPNAKHDSDAARKDRIEAWLKRVFAYSRLLQQALDRVDTPPDDVSMHLVLGTAPTHALLGIDPVTGASRWIADQPGDGRVTHKSAMLATSDRAGGAVDSNEIPAFWKSVTIGGGDHFNMVMDPGVIDRILSLVLDPTRSEPIPDGFHASPGVPPREQSALCTSAFGSAPKK